MVNFLKRECKIEADLVINQRRHCFLKGHVSESSILKSDNILNVAILDY